MTDWDISKQIEEAGFRSLIQHKHGHCVQSVLPNFHFRFKPCRLTTDCIVCVHIKANKAVSFGSFRILLVQTGHDAGR